MNFTIYPAIDLRHGQVVRLEQGDAARVTFYGSNPAEVARHWLGRGARWLHVVNLDGAWGERASENQRALAAIVVVARAFGASVQFGGGLRSWEALEWAIDLGVERLILGTLALENPALLGRALEKWGAARLAVSLDADPRGLRSHGWRRLLPAMPDEIARALHAQGVRTFIFTDTERDGLQTGLNLAAAQSLLTLDEAEVILAGGARDLEDVRAACHRGFAGVILGRALYQGTIDFSEALRVCSA